MGDTRRVVDGERRATARPLRPAAPPDDGTPPIPRPRRAGSDPVEKPQLGPGAKADAEPGSGGDEQPDSGPETKAEAAAESGGRRRRMPFAHAVRTRPRQLTVGAARATRAWSRRPGGRTTLPALFLLALVAA
ncbi:murein transglycosylase, partial [Micromonospora aurantiaca]